MTGDWREAESSREGYGLPTKPRERAAATGLVIIFIALWFLSLDQYLFLPLACVVLWLAALDRPLR